MSEDQVARHSRSLGRYGYLTLGSTTLAQLKRSRYVRGSLAAEDERRKPDAIVFLPLGGIKAVIEIKQPRELTAAKLPRVVEHYAPIARAVCKILIITDGQKTYWYNPLTEQPIMQADDTPLRLHVDPARLDSGDLAPEDLRAFVSTIELADQSLTDQSNELVAVRVIDPSALAKTVWQKIWINTGKEPEKCLYNVVEILVFKFLSDIGVLTGNVSFSRIVRLLAEEDAQEALRHYADRSRKRIKELFPAGDDGTTVINGTIFVNEAGQPNISQAELFAMVIRDFQKFDDEYGSLAFIDRQFKTRLYESFLRQQAGIRSLGQYFTPRNVVQAMVRMSNADRLSDGASVCDPFCGVGGFLLEAIAENPALLKQFEPRNNRVDPKITFVGYDKGSDEKEDERTIILAKANMLVYLSDLLSANPSPEYLREFADNAFNSTFKLLRTNLGTFGKVDETSQHDLILTNPPYVTSGSATIRSAIEAENLQDFYDQPGRGTEALAMQWIVKHLKAGGEAFLVVPDGLMNQTPMLEYVKTQCEVLTIAALPSRTFYSTPKKTYILGLRKKADPTTVQTRPVLTYLVSEIGESRDTRRVSIDENDLTALVSEFKYFDAQPNAYVTADPRCKIVSWDDFNESHNWLVDRAWTHAEKVELGISEETFEVDPIAFRGLVDDARTALDELLTELSS